MALLTKLTTYGERYWKKVVFGFSSAYLLTSHVGLFTSSEGPSMLPTINIMGDFFYLDRLFWRRKPLELGHLVVFISPVNPNRVVVKRLIGLPGDTVFEDPRTQNTSVVVPNGHIWVQGDNLSLSLDSTSYGPVPMGLILGRLTFQLLPFNKFGFITNPVEKCTPS
ncbi:peptidase S24/S26A/S26B/S26C [Globomyces pollinis-pini]|nr:peptidase S24/S26A/S26B/S26C [Globomyces pollinis-pini]